MFMHKLNQFSHAIHIPHLWHVASDSSDDKFIENKFLNLCDLLPLPSLELGSFLAVSLSCPNYPSSYFLSSVGLGISLSVSLACFCCCSLRFNPFASIACFFLSNSFLLSTCNSASSVSCLSMRLPCAQEAQGFQRVHLWMISCQMR